MDLDKKAKFGVGQVVALYGGKSFGIIIAKTSIDNEGRVTAVLGPSQQGYQVLPRVWIIMLLGAILPKTSSVIIQEREENLTPAYFKDLSLPLTFSATQPFCPICQKTAFIQSQVNEQNETETLDAFFSEKLPSEHTEQVVSTHPLFKVLCCTKCRHRILDDSFDISTQCAVCATILRNREFEVCKNSKTSSVSSGSDGDDRFSLPGIGCANKICTKCIHNPNCLFLISKERAEALYKNGSTKINGVTTDAECSVCFFNRTMKKQRTKLKNQVIDDENKKKKERFKFSKDRRVVLKELEAGARIFPSKINLASITPNFRDYKHLDEEKLDISDKFLQTGVMDLSSHIFKNSTYFQNSEILLKKNVFDQGFLHFSSDLFIESYFLEILNFLRLKPEMKEQINVKGLYHDCFKSFVIINTNQTSLNESPSLPSEIIQTTLNKSLVNKHIKKRHFKTLVKGSSGGYVTTCSEQIKQNDLVFEFMGDFTEMDLMQLKRSIVELGRPVIKISKDLVLDASERGNLSHFVRVCWKEEDANLMPEFYSDERKGAAPQLRVVVVAARDIQPNEELTLLYTVPENI
eukprot:maker-scaffold_27-snap-gene-0.35-mRNA-1 protein AED:0.00 eAED:0.00 QI:29/1/1/1/1/1/4/19/576